MANTPIKRNDTTLSEATSSAASKKPVLDPYYSGVSKKFRAAKHITALLLVVLLVFSFTFMRNDITLENLRYLLKFISFTNTETSITATKINYPSGDPNKLDLFIGDLCTLSPEGYALYDSRGNQIMAEDIKYASPVLKIGKRFALCYDLDGNSFTVLNTFTKLYEGSTEYPITDGSIADNGSFAIASSSREYRTAITVYNSDFTAVTRILKNDHLMALELKPDASQLIVMTSGAKDGCFYSNIEIVVPGTDKVISSATIDGLGYAVYYTDDGFCVVTDEGILFLDQGLNQVSFREHTSQLAMSHFSGKYLTAVYSSAVIGNSYSAVIYDTNGREIFSGDFDGKLIAVDSDDSGYYIFILTGTTLSRINLINKKIGSIPVASAAIDILVPDENTVLVALKNYALTYSLNQFEENYYSRQADTNQPQNTEETGDQK